MDIADAQREMRDVYLDGAVGQAVSATVWLAAAAVGTWGSVRAAVLTLVLGGMVIFPLTQLVLTAMGRRASVGVDNPLRALAPQVAFIVHLLMPLAIVALLYRTTWFFPAFMIIVGAHYLPFAFLYGRRAFLALAAALLVAGFALAFIRAAPFATGAWVTTAILAVFSASSASRSMRSP